MNPPDEALENLQIINRQEQRRKQLEHELDTSAAQINKQRLIIRQLEKDKDRSKEHMRKNYYFFHLVKILH